MKVALTSTGRDLDAPLSAPFGRCAWFLFVDEDDAELAAVANPAADAAGGAGVKAAQLVVDRGARVVLTGRVGPNAMEVLEAAGVEVFDAGAASAREALEAWRAGRLPRITTAAPAGRHGGGGGGGGRRFR